jgi:hypothetical protein
LPGRKGLRQGILNLLRYLLSGAGEGRYKDECCENGMGSRIHGRALYDESLKEVVRNVLQEARPTQTLEK